MLVDANGFVFDNKTSDEFGLIICTIEGNESSETSGGQIEFQTTSSPIQNRWYKTGNSNYKEPLSFGLSVTKSNFEPFDTYEYSSIERWLVRKDSYKDFMLVKSDYDNIHFNVQLNIEPVEVGKNIVGIVINGICDAPFGYNQLITKTIDTNETDILTLVDLSDEIGYIYPDIEINVKNDCDVKITNVTENNRLFYIKNCVANEIIKIDGKYLTITTTALSHNIYDNNTNYVFPRIINDYNKRKNVFKIEGDCTVTIKYRPIRKVVV